MPRLASPRHAGSGFSPICWPAWTWGAYLGDEGMRRGIRVKTSSYTRHHVNITMTQAKAVSNDTNSILANMEATDDGYDEALPLDPSGFVSEGAGENIFVAVVELAAADLVGPGVTFCPNPRMPLWSNHPKVFIDVVTAGEGRCPYCGTLYRLKAGEKAHGGAH